MIRGYGMLDLDTLTSTLEEDVEDGEMPFIDHVDRVCDRRLVGEQHRRPFLAQSTYRASDALEQIGRASCRERV